MKKVLLSILLIGFLAGCGHPVTIGVAIWLLQGEKHKKRRTPVLTISPATLNEGIKNVSYPTVQFSATGGSGTYNWTCTGLPAGLIFDDVSAQLLGTPTASGDFSVTVEATDTANAKLKGSRSYQLHIVGIRITTTTLPDGCINQPYPATTIQYEGGTTPLNWSWNGNTPESAGLSLNPGTGEITGTPTSGGKFTFTVTVTDKDGDTDDQQFTMSIKPILITTASLPDSYVNASYNQTLTAVGGLGTLSWSWSGNTPPGLSLDSASGVISGNPTTAGNYTFTVTVTDSDTPPSSDSKDFTIHIYEDLQISTTTLPDATVAIPYSQQVQSTGGSGNFTWSLATTPAIPSGALSIDSSTGVISGTPQVGDEGSYTCTVTVTDNVTGDSDTADIPLTIKLVLLITTTSLPDSYVNASYNQTLTAVGGVGTLSWSWSGNTPPGLSLDSASGVISGNPTTAGNYTFTVTVTDSNTPPSSDSKDFTIHIYEVLRISTASLPNGVVGASYSADVDATGGSGDFTWSLSGAPPSLSIDTSTGVITGTPQLGEQGNYTFTVTVTDNVTSDSDSKDFPVTITKVQITTASIPTAFERFAYSTTIQADNGTPPYSYTLQSPQRPLG